MIGAGKLDRKVTIQDYTKTKDAFGQEVETWQDVVTVPCGKKDLISTSTQEASEAAQEQTKTTSEFTIRYYAGLEGNYRLKFENEIYEIVRVAERGRKRYTILIAYAMSSDFLD